MATKQNLKQWFETGKKPTQEQFWAWIDSYRHVDEPLSVEEINGLKELLNGKAEQEAVQELQRKMTEANETHVPDWSAEIERNINF